MINDDLDFCQLYAKKFDLVLLECKCEVFDSFGKPVYPSHFRLCDKKGNIITYGSISNIKGYFLMHNRF